MAMLVDRLAGVGGAFVDAADDRFRGLDPRGIVSCAWTKSKPRLGHPAVRRCHHAQGSNELLHWDAS